jgi:hypothetical protein
MADTIKYVAVEVAGKPSPSKLLHRADCGHLRDAGWPEPVLREAEGDERARRKCQSCLAAEAREAGR